MQDNIYANPLIATMLLFEDSYAFTPGVSHIGPSASFGQGGATKDRCKTRCYPSTVGYISHALVRLPQLRRVLTNLLKSKSEKVSNLRVKVGQIGKKRLSNDNLKMR